MTVRGAGAPITITGAMTDAVEPPPGGEQGAATADPDGVEPSGRWCPPVAMDAVASTITASPTTAPSPVLEPFDKAMATTTQLTIATGSLGALVHTSRDLRLAPAFMSPPASRR